MIKANTSYKFNLVEPFFSTKNYPVKLFNIHASDKKYKLRYIPVSLHSSLLMTDYLAGSRVSLSDAAFSNLQEALKEQLNVSDEFIVVIGKRNDLGATSNGLAYYGDKGDTRASDVETINIQGEELVVQQAVVVDKFVEAYRNLRKNTQIHFSVTSNRDRRHDAVNLKSISFDRDHSHVIKLSKLRELQRDFEHSLVVAHTVKSSRDFISKAEISAALGQGQRDFISDMVVVNADAALRHDSFLMTTPSMIQFERDYIAEMGVHPSIVTASRTDVFDMLKDFYIYGERPIKKGGAVQWSHVVAERIMEADLTVQQALTYAERKLARKGVISSVLDVQRNQLKEAIVHHALEQAKLKARQYPSVVHYGARSFDLLKQRTIEIERKIDSVRNIRANLVLPNDTNSVRDITSDAQMSLVSSYKRDISTETSVIQALTDSVRDKVIQVAVNYTLGTSKRDNIENIDVSRKLIQSLRDNVENIAVSHKYIQSQRAFINKMAVEYDNTEQYLRDFVSNATADFALGNSVRDIKHTVSTPSRILISSKRDNTQSLDIKQLTEQFDRDIVSGLYIKRESSVAERNTSNKLTVSTTGKSVRNKSKLLRLSELDSFERDNVKDLMLSFIGNYIRSNQFKMGDIELPPETVVGGSLPPSTYDGLVMEDEVIGELVDNFADFMHTVYLGQPYDTRKGSELAGSILAIRNRIEALHELGFLQASEGNLNGILQFPDAQALIEKGVDLTDGLLFERPLSEGHALEKDYTGQVPNRIGVSTNLELGDQIDYEGLTEEDKMAFGYLFADAADFLPPEELAKLNSQKGNNLNDELTLNTQLVENGGCIADDTKLVQSSDTNSGMVDSKQCVELLGFHSILLNPHLHDDLILAKLIIKIYPAVVHEVLDAVNIGSRDSVELTDDFLGQKAALTSHLTTRQFAGFTDRIAEINNELKLFEKAIQNGEMLNDILAYKERLVNLEQEIVAIMPIREGANELLVESFKEKIVLLSELLTGYKHERNFSLETNLTGSKTVASYTVEAGTLEASTLPPYFDLVETIDFSNTTKNGEITKLLLADNPIKDGEITKLLLADNPIKDGEITKLLLADNPIKDGVIHHSLELSNEKQSLINNEVVAEKEGEAHQLNTIDAYVNKYAVTTDLINTVKDIGGTTLTELILGQRTDLFEAVRMTEHVAGRRTKLFEAYNMVEYSLGKRENIFDGIVICETFEGGRVNEFGAYHNGERVEGSRVNYLESVVESSVFLGTRPISLGQLISTSIEGTRISDFGGYDENVSFMGTKISDAGITTGDYKLASKFKESVLTIDKFVASKEKPIKILTMLNASKNTKGGLTASSLIFDKFDKSSILSNTLLADKQYNNSILGEVILTSKGQNKSVLTDIKMASRQGKGASSNSEYIVGNKLSKSHLLDTIAAVKQHISDIFKEITAERTSKLALVESSTVLGNKGEYGGYLINNQLMYKRTSGESVLLESILSELDKRKATLSEQTIATIVQRDVAETHDIILANSSPFATHIEKLNNHLYTLDAVSVNLLEGTGVVATKGYLETLTTVVDEVTAVKNSNPVANIVETHEANLLEKYSVTQEQYVEASTYMWVGILTNLLVADEEKARSYVDYLVQAGAVHSKHYELLNGLVGDLALKQGLAYGEELVSVVEKKSELLESLEGRGLLYDYNDFESVLNPSMDIEDWELDLGFGLPERYDPYDPYNSYYPSLLENYGHSALSLMQLEEWETFGGNNWERDELHGNFRSVVVNTNSNGYILNKNGMVDYKISVDFKVDLEEESNDGVGVVFKYSDEQNYYKFVIVGGATNSIGMNYTYMQLYKVVNGVQQPVGSAISPESYEKGEWHNIKVSYVGKEILIWVNNRLQYEMTDI